jgi:hypothetical protein
MTTERRQMRRQLIFGIDKQSVIREIGAWKGCVARCTNMVVDTYCCTRYLFCHLKLIMSIKIDGREVWGVRKVPARRRTAEGSLASSLESPISDPGNETTAGGLRTRNEAEMRAEMREFCWDEEARWSDL